uniref:hypothetical protein n=1 Tax=Streptomyces gossypii TaxID=2883101 RepID=UPI0035CCD261
MPCFSRPTAGPPSSPQSRPGTSPPESPALRKHRPPSPAGAAPSGLLGSTMRLRIRLRPSRVDDDARQLAPLFGVSKSAADRVIDDIGPRVALHPRQRFAKDAVLIVDGTLVPTRDHNKSHKQVRARVEHAFARMKTWKILRDCRLRGEGVHHAMHGVARLRNLALTG